MSTFIFVFSIISGACSIISLVMTIVVSKRKNSINNLNILILAISFILIAASSAGFMYYYNENSRIKDIHRKASAIYESRYSMFEEEYIEAVLTFLETNKDIYPDAYKSASRIREKTVYDSNDARKLNGMIKGIVIDNEHD